MITKQCCRTQSLKESEVRSENDSEEEETYLALIVSILELLECGE